MAVSLAKGTARPLGLARVDGLKGREKTRGTGEGVKRPVRWREKNDR